MLQGTLTPDQMSSIFGSMSVACWLVVYTPQIWENYQLKSGDGLSVAFVVLWLLGDLTGLLGAVMAKLVPTVIVLAIYYTLCDVVLLAQVYYYRQIRLRARRDSISPAARAAATESSPLILPADPNPPPAQPKPLLPPHLLWLEYPLLIAFVLLAGAGAWYLEIQATPDVSIPENPGPGQGGHGSDGVEFEWKSQLLGWSSAVLYFGSRIPQIIHNFRTRCAGLSLALFFFTITGNLTYSASILAPSLDPKYILANASWLAGALLTVFLDIFVMAQFAVYGWQDKKRAQEGKGLQHDEEEDSALAT
ncbi:PQ loop repeat-domain-containing protein [Dioszegia hungarica]|uniref:PQ loop repeat-domain-containing protein n=1 Tax=Dioszegia hungarica TaxID=4972 RepID=A0AA38H7U6_9TREE|nr:PQ loop repeat-domain-containing protein [Dioszegia hungarica]KAI9635285.1 PQ loop repeat-domain-containing protein [Dioszegia hungarica]